MLSRFLRFAALLVRKHLLEQGVPPPSLVDASFQVSLMSGIYVLPPAFRADAYAFDIGKVLRQEATLGILVMNCIMPRSWIAHSRIPSLGSQPFREFIAPCVHVGASAATSIELELENTIALCIHVMAKPRMQKASRWIKLAIHAPTVSDGKTVWSQLLLQVLIPGHVNCLESA